MISDPSGPCTIPVNKNNSRRRTENPGTSRPRCVRSASEPVLREHTIPETWKRCKRCLLLCSQADSSPLAGLHSFREVRQHIFEVISVLPVCADEGHHSDNADQLSSA